VQYEHESAVEGPILKHSFHTPFREVSISSIHPSSASSPSPTISFLAHDALHGLFHYHVHLPTLNVKFIGAYSLSQSSSQSHPPSAGSTRGFVSACCLGKQGKRGMWIERGRGSTRRGVIVFESGQEGRDMEVVNNGQQQVTTKFDGHNDQEVEEAGNRPASTDCGSDEPPTATIDGRVVYEVGSYDLRVEDLTHCTFSEVSGRIALGNRSGSVMIL